MKVQLGVKSDPIETRYSFDWLFEIMADFGVHNLQLGSSFPVFFADDEYFRGLRTKAERRGVRIASLFSSHREFGGFASGDPLLEDATRRGWERLIHVASLVGADTAGSNAGIVHRDEPHLREPGVQCFFRNIKPLLLAARKAGLKGLTVEPMSSLFEFPSTPIEVLMVANELAPWYTSQGDDAARLLLCGDISHGVADAEGRVQHDNWSLFEMEIPWMWEFHFKNTDSIFNSTFGFSPEERRRGIVDLNRLKGLLDRNADRFPVREPVGYLELGGPKVGRDYTDPLLKGQLTESLQALKDVFG